MPAKESLQSHPWLSWHPSWWSCNHFNVTSHWSHGFTLACWWFYVHTVIPIMSSNSPAVLSAVFLQSQPHSTESCSLSHTFGLYGVPNLFPVLFCFLSCLLVILHLQFRLLVILCFQPQHQVALQSHTHLPVVMQSQPCLQVVLLSQTWVSVVLGFQTYLPWSHSPRRNILWSCSHKLTSQRLSGISFDF